MIEMNCAVSDDVAIASTLETQKSVDQKQSQKPTHNSESGETTFHRICGVVREKMKIDVSRVPVRKWQRFEFTMLVMSIIVVWGLVLLPVVFYYIPNSKVRHGSIDEGSNTDIPLSIYANMLITRVTIVFSDRHAIPSKGNAKARP